MEMIAAEGAGVILYLRREGDGNELFTPPSRRERAHPSTSPWGRLQQFRDFGIGAQILRDVGVGKMRWLTNRARQLVGLAGYGLEIVDVVPIPVDRVPDSESPSRERAKIVQIR
jgi:3,4-dihydroxy 2-butanone 4-phosphate synthase/GTP cyclohydrolase II